MGDEPDDSHAHEPADGLPRRAKLGIAVLLATALLATLAGVGGQALVDGYQVTLPVPDAAELRRIAPIPTPDERDGTTRSSNVPSRVAAAEALLDKQAQAVLDGNRDAYLETIDPASSEFAAVAARTFDNLARLPVQTYRFRTPVADPNALSPERQQALGGKAWVADVLVDIGFAGGDDGLWTTALRVTFVDRADGLYVANDWEGQPDTAPRPLWLQAEVHAARSEHGLVIGTGSQDRLDELADAVDSGVPQVNAVWAARWPEYVIVLAPASQEQMEATIGADAGSQDQVAAVTTAVGRRGGANSSHVVVNPANLDEIGELSQQIVLTHEIVHVATEATVSTVPMWLSEGFADYVAFSNAGLAPSTVAGAFLEEVRESGPPEALPDSDEFDPRGHRLDRAYEAAWLACRFVAERWGEDALVEFYRRMGDVVTDEDEAQVFREVLDTTHGSFLDEWAAYVETVAGG